ncbi:MAG: hypothetical protein EAZ77_06970 [Nostocales cyanobacterium]|nr:MAG: hypothetical protein EAZ77_06970 [Nostocales cyanobacterium]
MYQIFSDPPKSSLKRGTLKNLAPLFKGGWGEWLRHASLSNRVFDDNKKLLKQPLNHHHQVQLTKLTTTKNAGY